MGIFDVIKRVLPISDNDQYCLELLEDEEEYKQVKNIIKQRKAKFLLQKFNISIYPDGDYFQLVSELPELNELLIKVNAKLKLLGQKEIFSRFAQDAFPIIRKIISSNVSGMAQAKSAVALQLFTKEDLHILIFGDNVSKKELINNAAHLSPISIVSRASNAMADNALYHANGGLCAIHELLMMHRLDKSDFYNALSKGFILEDNMRYDTKAKILATSTPSGGLARTFESIKNQLPESKLLTRFHLTFLAKNAEEASRTSIKSEDIEFIKDYINFSQKLEVKISKEFEDHLKQFALALKKKEHYFFMDVNENLASSLMLLAKASARSRLSENVEVLDLERAKEIVFEGLKSN